MEKYNSFCTKDQTKRAYKLGAPIETLSIITFLEGAKINPSRYVIWHDEEVILGVPTTYQLLAWLEDKGIYCGRHIIYSTTGELPIEWQFTLIRDENNNVIVNVHGTYKTRLELEYAMIDEGLTYLEKLSEA